MTSSTSSRRSPTRSSCTGSRHRHRSPSSRPRSSSSRWSCSTTPSHLQGFKGLDRYWIEVHSLENEGDRIARAAIAGLFLDEKDPINLVRWKDVYGLLEDTIDKAEDVANIIERITIKHA